MSDVCRFSFCSRNPSFTADGLNSQVGREIAIHCGSIEGLMCRSSPPYRRLFESQAVPDNAQMTYTGREE